MKYRILVVDDDEPITEAVSLILQEEGYEVESVLKSEEIYKNVQSFKPHVILLDVLMSGKDGRQICKQLKNQASTKKIPVIMMSAHPSARSGSVDSGADDFLPKPFESNDLLSLISKYKDSVI